MNIRNFFAKNYINAKGWRTKSKYVLFESDDWGAVRMPDRRFYELLVDKGYHVENYYFDKYDALESNSDLSYLFEVLSSIRDINGNPAVFTPLCVVANPDFCKIRENGFEKYFYEPTSKTYLHYSGSDNTYQIAQQGIRDKVWAPQFHGREHIQVRRYLKALHHGTPLELLCFGNQAILGFVNYGIDYFPSFAIDDANDIPVLSSIIRNGLDLFEKIYGYTAISFCPPCGVMNSQLFKILDDCGVKNLQAGQYTSPEENGKIRHFQYHWGHRNQWGQIFTRRNCTFEPARNHNIDWVDRCMKEIEIAFRWGKPACINTHRVSYISRIFEANRDDSLRQLKRLLVSILKEWPDTKFISSEQLYHIMREP